MEEEIRKLNDLLRKECIKNEKLCSQVEILTELAEGKLEALGYSAAKDKSRVDLLLAYQQISKELRLQRESGEESSREAKSSEELVLSLTTSLLQEKNNNATLVQYKAVTDQRVVNIIHEVQSLKSLVIPILSQITSLEHQVKTEQMEHKLLQKTLEQKSSKLKLCSSAADQIQTLVSALIEIISLIVYRLTEYSDDKDRNRADRKESESENLIDVSNDLMSRATLIQRAVILKLRTQQSQPHLDATLLQFEEEVGRLKSLL